MWQKCPICDGEGRVTSNGFTSSVHQVCPVCKGAKIISELNGLPPNYSVETPSNVKIISEMELSELINKVKEKKILTAVEWLLEKIQLDASKAKGRLYENIQKAIEIEKNQIAKAFWMGERNGERENPFKSVDEYYEYNFGRQGNPDTTTSPTK